MKTHLQQCSGIIIPCAAVDIKCPWEGKRQEMNNHLKRCVFQRMRPIIQHLQTEARAETLRHNKVHNELSSRVTAMNRLIQRQNRQLQEQNRFIRAFINNGKPLSDICRDSPEYCRVQGYFAKQYCQSGHQNLNALSNDGDPICCTVCHTRLQFDHIPLHHCEGSCICRSCIEKYCNDGNDLGNPQMSVMRPKLPLLSTRSGLQNPRNQSPMIGSTQDSVATTTRPLLQAHRRQRN